MRGPLLLRRRPRPSASRCRRARRRRGPCARSGPTPRRAGPPAASRSRQAAEVDARHPAQVDHQHARPPPGRGGPSSAGTSQPVSSSAAGSQTAKIRGWSPVIVQRLPSSASQAGDDLPVADGQRVPQHVGEVVLLADQDVDQLDLVVGDDEVLADRSASSTRPAALGGDRVVAARRPRPAGRRRTPGSSRAPGSGHSRGPRPSRAATARPARRPGRGRRDPSTRRRGRPVEAVLEDRQPRERPLLVGRQQVPRPRDHGLEGAVPVGRAAVAAAERGEPVVRARRPPRPPSSCARGPRRARRPAAARRAARPPARTAVGSSTASGRVADGPADEQLGGVAGGQLAERHRALGGQPQRRPAGRQHLQVARGRQQEGDERGDRLEDVLAVVEHQQGRAGVELRRDPTAYVGLLGRREASAGSSPSRARRGRADGRHHVVAGAHADELDHAHVRQRRLAGERLGDAGLADAAGTEDGHQARRRRGPPAAGPGRPRARAAARRRSAAGAHRGRRPPGARGAGAGAPAPGRRRAARRGPRGRSS